MARRGLRRTSRWRKQQKRTPTVWAILDRERNIQLYFGREPPYLDGAFAAAPRGTRFRGQFAGPEAKRAIGFELHKTAWESRVIDGQTC